MYTNHCKSLSDQQLSAIVQKIYMQVPRVKQLLGPHGWKQSDYHQQIQQQQVDEYEVYLNELLVERQDESSFIHPYEDDKTYLDEYAVHYEDYFIFQFPCLDHDEGEVFAILLHLLYDLTITGVLISYHEVEPCLHHYYVHYDDLSTVAIKVAYQNDLIPKENTTISYLNNIQVVLEDLDLFHCMQIIFEILQTENYQWYHRDSDLVYILVAHHEYQFLEHSDVPFMERYQQQNEIVITILNILSPYQKDWLNALDFTAILSLYNRYKTNYCILAYLHTYHSFPRGYPYRASDYYDH